MAVGDLQTYLAVKGQQYEQANTAVPALITSGNPYHFYSSVAGSDSNAISSASFALSKTKVFTLTNSEGEFTLEQSFATKKLLDKTFSLGTYKFSIQTLNDGLQSPALKLLKETYPPVPRIANWSDLQEIEPELPTTLSWDAFTGGTAKDFVMLDIFETGGDLPVISSPALIESGALNGTNVSFEIPAGTLATNHTYDAQLLFVKSFTLDESTIPTATGLAGFYRQTRFAIQTLSAAPAAGRLQFSARDFNAGENDGSAVITITRSGAENDVTVHLTTSNGTATDGADYQSVNTTVTLPAGIVSTNVLVPVLNDFLLEGNETVNLSLSSPTGGAVLGSRSNAVLTIVDDEQSSAGVIQFLRSSYTAKEKGKKAVLTLKRSGGKTGVVSVNYHTLNGSASAGSDYIGTNGTVTFKSKAVSASFSIPVLDDSLDESNETFSVVLDTPSGGAALGTNLTATISITDDDTAGSIAFSAASYSATENAGELLVTVKRTGGKSEAASVDYATANGTALAGQDYTATSGTLVFGANELTKTISIPISNDFAAEGNEAFAIQLSNPSGGATLGAAANATLNIVDDENSVSLAAAAYTVSEASRSVAITVVRSGSLSSAVSVQFATQNGTAGSPGDFGGTNFSLTFAAKISSRTVVIPIINDSAVEGGETFSVVLSNPQGGAQLGSIANATVTITDDDVAGTVKFSAATYSVNEGTANASITIQRTDGLAGGVGVRFSTGSGTATAGSDYTAVTTDLTFAAGETSKTVLIPIAADSLAESTETVNLTLSNVSGGATLGAPSTAVLSIGDKPDPNAVPIDGPIFMSGTIGGKAFSVSQNPAKQQSIAAARMGSGLNISASWLTGSGLNSQPHLFSIVPAPLAVGTFTMDNNGSHGLMNYVISSFSGSGKAWSVADGSGSVGSFGTFTFDAIDTNTKMASGRFSFHAKETTDGAVNPGFMEFVGKFRLKYQ